MVNAFDAIF